jgi:hypothetical protein
MLTLICNRDVAVNEFRQGPSQRFGPASFETRSTSYGTGYLRRLAELLPANFGDGDVWRCAHRAVREILQAPRRKTA